MKIKPRTAFRIVWFTLVTIFFIWQWSTYQSRGLPEDTFSETESVRVEETEDKITFKSKTGTNSSEVIFFQGGLTDPKAYAPLCRKIAENGFTCHLIKMDWRLPRYDYQKTHDMFDLKRGNYILGGHSQGAMMAAQFVFENPNLIKGLFLMGTSHPRDIDMSMIDIPTIKLYAERDGLASVPEVMENKMKLPGNARLVLIEGGNHSQFGYLGTLLMDESAEIDLVEQQELTLGALVAHFREIESEDE